MDTDRHATQPGRLHDQLAQFRAPLVRLADSLIAPALRTDLEASDLVQQTLLEAHRHTDRLTQARPGQLFRWLQTALRRNVVDAVRHLAARSHDVRRRRRMSELADSPGKVAGALAGQETSPSQVAMRREQVNRLRVALTRLPDRQRTAIVLKHVEGRSLREVALAMQLSEPAAAGLLHRGRRRLLSLLEAIHD